MQKFCALIIMLISAIACERVGATDSASRRCHSAGRYAEARYGIPKNLLQAISLGESGRINEEGKFRAWPWTVQSQGKGQYFSSKSAAIQEVKRLWKEGIKNIDVGCMQVNLMYHPQAFNSLEEAFDPEKNVQYAAGFLSTLKKSVATWSKAVAHYHSANYTLNKPYQERIMKLWDVVQRHGLEGDDLAQHAQWSTGVQHGWTMAHSPFKRLQVVPLMPANVRHMFSVARPRSLQKIPTQGVAQKMEEGRHMQGGWHPVSQKIRGGAQFFSLKRGNFIPVK